VTAVLIIDDERAIGDALRPVLISQGCDVTIALSAAEGLERARNGRFDVVLLDLGLPDADGKDLIVPLKRLNPMAILILSARHQEKEKVEALDAGADDYLNKPFGIEELLARIRAAVRRQGARERETSFRSRDLTVHYDTRRVFLLGDEMKLSPKEFDLLEALCRQAGQVVTQRRLLLAGWGDPSTDGQYLRSYIGMLRQKLEEDPGEPRLIQTEPGVGYRLNTASLKSGV
jgi:two-component system, OmpR family, KDP operon response regulator KdpE